MDLDICVLVRFIELDPHMFWSGFHLCEVPIHIWAIYTHFYIWRAACPRVPRLRNYKFGKTAFDKYIPPPKISRSAPPDFHKFMFGGGVAEKCRECQIMTLSFLYLAGGSELTVPFGTSLIHASGVRMT